MNGSSSSSSSALPALFGAGIIGGVIAYVLLSKSAPAPTSATATKAPRNSGVARPPPAPIPALGGLPPSDLATPGGPIQVSLGVGPKGGTPSGAIAFAAEGEAVVYFDATLPKMREKYAAQGGALALNGPGVAGKLAEWPPAVIQDQAADDQPGASSETVKELPLIPKGPSGAPLLLVDELVKKWATMGHTPTDAELETVVRSIAAIEGKQFTPAQVQTIKMNVLSQVMGKPTLSTSKK